MIRVCLSLVLASAQLSGQSIAQVAAQSQPASNKSGVTAKYVNTPLEEALRDVATRGRVKINFTAGKLPSGAQVTQEFINVAPEDAFKRLLQGTKLRVVEIAGDVWAVAPAGEQKNAVQGVIAGKVTDAKTGKGVAGATVSIGMGARRVTTTEDGSYRLGGIAPGVQSVTVRLVGYAKQVQSVTVGEGATATVDFKLEPSASVLDQVVVTGTVASTELKAVPNAITVITAKQIEDRGITRIDQLFRGEVPGLYAANFGSSAREPGQVHMASRGSTQLDGALTQTIKTYVDGIELADPSYLGLIDPKSIERIEILAGPQASTIYGSNAINGVMQIFTKRGTTAKPKLTLSLLSGVIQNNFSSALTPRHDYSVQASGLEASMSYATGASWLYQGPWTPSVQATTISGFGGVRLQKNTLAVDMSLRQNLSTNKTTGGENQQSLNLANTGVYLADLGDMKVAQRERFTSGAQTLALSVTYTPKSWWSQTASGGMDGVDARRDKLQPAFVNPEFPGDTLLRTEETNTKKRSLAYTTTLRVPLTSIAEGIVTVGADGWHSTSSSLTADPMALTGNLTGIEGLSRTRSHSRGAFVQGQIAVRDALFLTYGLRSEWNPNYGSDANPNVTPRYGLAYTHDMNVFTAKIRGSYGRSTRPPLASAGDARKSTNSAVIGLVGPYDEVLANSDLVPESQQGWEGGAELYFGNRGSINLTRYNQTVDDLITRALSDSARSLQPLCVTLPSICNLSVFVDRWPDGYYYAIQYEDLNLGSVRNQGWELQGTLNLGPLVTKGTYSWVKSRIIGITPKFRAQFPQYQVGQPFQFLPEHTWGAGVQYVREGTTVSFNLQGQGLIYRTGTFDDLPNQVQLARYSNYAARMDVPDNYVGRASGYTQADLNATHRLRKNIEGMFQVQNLTNFYQSDLSSQNASIGRQTSVGLRVIW